MEILLVDGVLGVVSDVVDGVLRVVLDVVDGVLGVVFDAVDVVLTVRLELLTETVKFESPITKIYIERFQCFPQIES